MKIGLRMVNRMNNRRIAISASLAVVLASSSLFAAEADQAVDEFYQCNRPAFSKKEAAIEAFGNGDIALMMELNE